MADSQKANTMPIASIGLQEPPDGGPGFGASVKIAGEPAVVYAVTSEWNQWNRDWVWWHAPDAAAVILLTALAAMTGMLWKSRGRGRVKGLVYCARCNHELVAPQVEVVSSDRARWSGPEARCPECGMRELPQIAGAYARRAKWGVRASWMVIGLAALVMGMSLARKDQARQSWQRVATWPSYRLAYVWDGWPIYRVTSVEDLRRTVVWRVPLDGSAPSRILEGGTSFTEPFVSENGQVVALPLKHRPGAVAFLDQQTGIVREVILPTEREMSATVAGFGPGGRSVLVALVAIQPTRIEFWRVDTQSGKPERVGLVNVPNGELPLMQFIPPVAIEDESGIRWAFAGATNRTDDLYRVFAFVGGSNGWKKHELDHSNPLVMARIAPDLSGVRLDWWPNESGVDTSKAFWSFEDGGVLPRLMEVPVPRVRLKMDDGTSGGRANAATNVRVLNAQTNEPIATLGESAGLGPNWMVTRDGRILAGVVTKIRPSFMQKWFANWPRPQAARLEVWDLSRK